MSEPTTQQRTPALDEQAALRAIVEGTVTETGEEFFRALVRSLASVLGTHGAWVTEYVPAERKLRGMAFYLGGGFVDGYETLIDGTPCRIVVDEKRLVHYPDRILDLFPNDGDIERTGAVSYMGVPMMDARENVLGHLAVMDKKPMPPEPRGLAIFRIFAARATAEMQRLRAEQQVREREEKLSRLINSAMDAIVDLDSQCRVAVANSAAERLFRCGAGKLIGRPISELMEAAGHQMLLDMSDRLKASGDGWGALHIPGTLEARRCDGKPARVEATMSRYNLRGQPCHTIIFRDLEERIEAERRIRSLTAETEYLRDQVAGGWSEQIKGRSKPIQRVLKDIEQVAQTDATVLLLGETGTGKELIARAIHSASKRSDEPLIRVNCAAIPATLIESEFFGHEKGAFTGATQKREGRFAMADGGTLFLDEVGELPLDLQAKLLRVLQEGEFEPLGSSQTRKVDVRVIAATNRDLAEASKAGAFREDLYYRLNVFPIRLPALRERVDDIETLARAAIERFARRMGKAAPHLDAPTLERLQSYSWPGNVRELENVIERAMITSSPHCLDLDRALPAGSATLPSASHSIHTMEQIEQLEAQSIIRALEACGGAIAGEGGAARKLGINPSTLRSRMKKLGIQRPA